MVKNFILSVAVHMLALHCITLIIPGVQLGGGFLPLLIAGFSLTLLELIIKPVLNVISFPVNIMTLGLFSLITNGIILYLLTVFVPNVTITSFTYPGGTYGGVSVASMEFTTLLTFAVTTVLLSLIVTIIYWLIE